MKNLKVLIVEDEEKLANLIRNSIKELFFKVAIAKDGIAVIVNNDNSVDELSTDQVKSIFTGETTSWSDVSK